MISPLQDCICSVLEGRGPRPPSPTPSPGRGRRCSVGLVGCLSLRTPSQAWDPSLKEAHVAHLLPCSLVLSGFRGMAVVHGWINELGGLGTPVYVRHVSPTMNEGGLGRVLLAVPVGGWSPRRTSRVSCPEVSREISLCVSPLSVFSSCGISDWSLRTLPYPFLSQYSCQTSGRKVKNLPLPQRRMLSDFQMWGVLPSR